MARLLHFNAFTTLFRLWTQLLNSREFSSTTRLSSKLLLLEKEKQSKWQQQSKLEVDDTRNAFCIPSCLKSSSTGCCRLPLPCQKELVFMPASSLVGRSKLVHCMQWYLCPTFCKTKANLIFKEKFCIMNDLNFCQLQLQDAEMQDETNGLDI